MIIKELIDGLEFYNRYIPALIEYKGELFNYSGPASWRGSYNELALNYGFPPRVKEKKVIDLIADLKYAVNAEFYGYKGGYFRMGEDTKVWVDNFGMATFQEVYALQIHNCKLVIRSRNVLQGA